MAQIVEVDDQSEDEHRAQDRPDGIGERTFQPFRAERDQDRPGEHEEETARAEGKRQMADADENQTDGDD